jgi:molybdopterin converting factor small subunit
MTSSPASTKTVAVRLFAAARERAGAEVVTVAVPTNARISDLRAAIGEAVPALRPLVRHLIFAVGTDYAPDDMPVPACGEIVAFPPVSGG